MWSNTISVLILRENYLLNDTIIDIVFKLFGGFGRFFLPDESHTVLQTEIYYSICPVCNL